MLQIACFLHVQFQTYFHFKVTTFDAKLMEYYHSREFSPFQIRQDCIHNKEHCLHS
jgi:hypothetical protein